MRAGMTRPPSDSPQLLASLQQEAGVCAARALRRTPAMSPPCSSQAGSHGERTSRKAARTFT